MQSQALKIKIMHFYAEKRHFSILSFLWNVLNLPPRNQRNSLILNALHTLCIGNAVYCSQPKGSRTSGLSLHSGNPTHTQYIMITEIASVIVTPLMMAAPADNVAPMPETPVAYNWATQNATPILSEEDMKSAAVASFCPIPFGKGAQCVDDWNIC